MIDQQLASNLAETIIKLGFPSTKVELTVPNNPDFGDFSSNVALQLAKLPSKKSYQSPIEIANDLLANLSTDQWSERVEVAGPGFLNFYLKSSYLADSQLSGIEAIPLDDKSEAKIDDLIKNSRKIAAKNSLKKYLVEYAQPNTHKEFHIGHLRNITLGESIARLLETQGHEIFRATYGSDIGLPVAKALWGVQQLKEDYIVAKSASLQQKAHFLGTAYAKAATAYTEDPKIKAEIDQLNKSIYNKAPEIVPLWQETRQWSLDYFQWIYTLVGTQFDAVYVESDTIDRGKQQVEKYLGKVFTEDEGAIIFPGEQYGLHNRVFITSQGNPTYEAKELGLTENEYRDFAFDQSLHVVGNEQTAYFQVVNKALEIIDPKWKDKKRHIAYGMVNLSTGKMSSRTGNIISAESLINQVKDKVKEIMGDEHLNQTEAVVEAIAIGAIKFSMLKFSAASDISFDIDQSVNLHGDSGPYLQYTFARMQSLLENARTLKATLATDGPAVDINDSERSLLRQLAYFEMIVNSAATELKPIILCEYLLVLARQFNLFYQHNPILKSEKMALRLKIVIRASQVLGQGLYLLGIQTPNRM